MKKLRPLWRRLIYVLIGIIILVFAGNIILNRVIEQQIKKQLGALAPYATVHFTSARANLFKLSLYMQGLDIAYHADTTMMQYAHTIHFKEASFTGINFFKMRFNKKLNISSLKLNGGTITADSTLLYKKDLPHYNLLARMPFTSVDIGRVTITQAIVLMHTGHGDDQVMKANCSIDDIHADQQNTTPGFSNVAFNMQDVAYTLPGLQHRVQLKQLVVNSRRKIMRVDSLQVTPLADTAPLRLKALLPLISMQGIDVMQLPAGKCKAGMVLIDKGDVNISVNSAAKKITQSLGGYVQYVKDIQIDSIKFTHANINCKPGDAISAGSTITDSLLPQSLAIKSAQVEDAKLTLQQDGKKEAVVNTLYVSGIQKFQDKKLSIANVEARLTAINGTLPGGLNAVHIGALTVSTKKEAMHIGDIQLLPKYDKYELGNKLGHQADYIRATVASIDISGLDVTALMDKKLNAAHILVNKANTYIFRDRRLPRPGNKQLLPVDYLRTLPIQLHVKKVDVKNSSVAYEEFPKDGKETGMLKVIDMQVSLSPLVNHATAGVDHLDNHMEASIMGSGSVNADITMPLTNTQEYHVQGVIKNLSLTSLNSTAENLGKFHVESGLLNTLNFEFWLNEEKAHGKIIGEYHDLVLDKLKGNDKKTAWVPTFALKNIIIPKNKDKSLPVSRRTGIIRYENDPTRFFSFYLVKALLSGIRDSFTLGFLLPK